MVKRRKNIQEGKREKLAVYRRIQGIAISCKKLQKALFSIADVNYDGKIDYNDLFKLCNACGAGFYVKYL